MAVNSGLEGVVVASTVLSKVDGEQGRLILRGAPVEALAGQVPFEAVAARLWEGLAPEPGRDADGVRAALGAARVLAWNRLQELLPRGAELPPIDGMRLGLSAFSDREDAPAHVLATAATGVLMAALGRMRAGAPPLPPDPARGHAADLLRMLRGAPASDDAAWALDAYLSTIADHGMNASTFTARVIASTRAGVISAVVGALCALKGPLHGGAPGPVLDMLDAIGSAENAPAWVASQLAAGERLMGFGHRVYRVRDPRADVLKQVVARLRAGGAGRLQFAMAVEEVILEALRRHKPDRPLHTNVEFYTALVLEAIGLDRALFTPAFACGRVVGWTAHVFEQERTGRLIRPKSEYVGP